MSVLLSTPKSTGWTADEKNHISHNYRFSFQAPFKNEGVVAAEQLLDEVKLLDFLDQTGPRIGSKQRPVTASLFFKRYAFCSLTACLYGMTMLNKSFDMKIENVYLIDHNSESMWLPSFTLKDASAARHCNGSREDFRSIVLETLFKENVTIMLSHVAGAARISKATLWENAWIYIRWIYETWLSEDHSEEMKQRIQEDYAFFMDAPAFHFGLSKNPFHRFAPPSGCEQTKVRKTCCLYYKTENGTCCSTCPKR
ncbi:(2Fe-2S)-binding protein [Fictibacillus nanhaiensis]|uniref:IucA/IucC family C-terminal-domain containing protein n=1 Tax=Fictibacillus nanhaiensis TaxID=742169 RepID=UPI001C94B36F|nr:IucA/IucC family C-terminal-domain containing protein [Fictibacillus nanhaiensis]MBY6036451.1 (2Fe-2S)-binding protein [Fictibacillus nanhaiensis]